MVWGGHGMYTAVQKCGPAPCLQCPPLAFQEAASPRDRIPRAFPEARPFAMGTDGEPRCSGRQGAYPHSSPTDQMFPAWADMGISALLSPEPRCLVSSCKNSPCSSARQLGSHGGGHLAQRTQSSVAGSSHGPPGLPWPPSQLCAHLGLICGGPGAKCGAGRGTGGGGGPSSPDGSSGARSTESTAHAGWGEGTAERGQGLWTSLKEAARVRLGGGPTFQLFRTLL